MEKTVLPEDESWLRVLLHNVAVWIMVPIILLGAMLAAPVLILLSVWDVIHNRNKHRKAKKIGDNILARMCAKDD